MQTEKRKYYTAAEKALLLKAYKSSGIGKKQWCKENAIGLSTLSRWLQYETKKDKSQPAQNWIPVLVAAPEAASTLEIQVGKCKIAVDNKTNKELLAAVLAIVVEVC